MSYDFYDNEDDNKSYQKTVALCVAAASLVVLIFLGALYMNSKKTHANNRIKEQSTEEETEDFAYSSHNFTSDELDFWEDAIEDENKPDPDGKRTQYKYSTDDLEESTESDLDSNTVTNKKESEKEKDTGEGSLEKNKDDDANDEKHLAVENEDGSKKYYEILSNVPKNKYNFEENLSNENGVISYKDNNCESVKGIDLSKYNGTVDWKSVKDAGVSFAMLKLGGRGYGTGLVELDDKFVENAQNAALNNINVGAYFYSQAINETEAIEEANYIVGAIGAFGVKYPVAIDIEKVKNDEARTDNLTSKERTAIAKAFCDTVKAYGYKPIIYANRDMLIAGMNLEELTEYDIWLADTNLPTDYPYDFTMWQYSNKGNIEGISGDVDMNISFINYEQK